ncbi:SDR family NAD(P)-dependent oxidoreductase [Microvirga sp. G4-2]|uniref:SDR family NAD(P)-dependent oxidoreductase n=1 Tax=Microvirga sp. G4-2 TaxID=3434467 RepID=UPI004044870C
MRLSGTVALITGAGGPMGRSVAERFAEEGATLVITDISGRRLDEARGSVTSRLRNGAEVVALRADITQAAEALQVVDLALSSFGQVDALINVVGGIRSTEISVPMTEMDEARWDDTFAFNIKGIFHLVKALAPGMQERRRGRIVNVSSINFAGEAGVADYGAAKAAIASLTRSLAIELAPAVNVNCIAPGLINTSVMQRLSAVERRDYANRTLLKRLGEPVDIANAALFLASDEASFITGHILPVSGGIWPAL